MKVALLGLDHPHAGVLLTTLENLPEITSITLWDANPDVIARTPFVTRSKVSAPTTDLDSVLAQPDLVFAIVCARHDVSAAICLSVVQAGKHLLAEKPVGFNSSQIHEVEKAAAKHGVVASVLYVRRGHPCMVAAKELLHSGSIGSLFSIECRFLTTQVKFRNPQSWLFRQAQAGGGILLWLGCHCLDLMQSVSGDEIVEVAAMQATRSGESISVEDTAVLGLRFRSGAIGSFHAGYTLAYSGSGYVNQKGYDSYLGFNGRDGRVVWPDLEPHLQIESPAADGQSPIREQTFPLPPSTSYGGSYGEAFFRQFIAATQGKASPPSTLADACQTARVIEAAAESSRTGRFVKINQPAIRAFHVPPFADDRASQVAFRQSIKKLMNGSARAS